MEKHPCFIHCRVPQIKTSEGKFELVAVPWARPDSRFSWAFEAQIMQQIATGTQFDKIAGSIQKDFNVITRIFNGWLHTAYKNSVLDNTLDSLGIDEIIHPVTGHHITVTVDLKNEYVIRVTPYANQRAIQDLYEYLKQKNISSLQIQQVTGPLSPDFAKHIKQYFPQASYCVDRFYVIQALNIALNHTRKKEKGHTKKLTENQDLFLMNHSLLSDEQKVTLLDLTTKFPNVGHAYKIKEAFDQLWEQSSQQEIQKFLNTWCQPLLKSPALAPFQKLAKMLISHQKQILTVRTYPINLNTLEKVHAEILHALSRTKGLKNIENVSHMIYFHCGKLTMPYPVSE